MTTKKKAVAKKTPTKVVKKPKKDILKDNLALGVNKVLLTQDGLKKLKEEKKFLEENKREEVAERLKEAISYGDLSENAEYEEAKNEQAFCEGRIVELRQMIENAELIDEKTAHKTAIVRIGTTIIIQNLTKKEDSQEFTIVGSTEADPFASLISNESPVGKASLGKKKGEKFSVEAPGGDYEFQLVDLK